MQWVAASEGEALSQQEAGASALCLAWPALQNELRQELDDSMLCLGKELVNRRTHGDGSLSSAQALSQGANEAERSKACRALIGAGGTRSKAHLWSAAARGKATNLRAATSQPSHVQSSR